MNGIYFPGLGIGFDNVPKGFTIFGFFLPLYAIVVTLGFILGLTVARLIAKKTGQNEEDYLDFFLVLVLPAILGARIYYIIFNLDRFVGNGKTFGQILFDMINIRNGGLAIYGGLITGFTALGIFAYKKKLYLPLMGDTVAPGILVGQILGRWGNFFNRECFGSYTSGVFRMAIPEAYYNSSFFSEMVDKGIVTSEMRANLETINGTPCLTVHPTFLYEGLWNTLLLIALLLYTKHKKFDGEVVMLYAAGYGLGRFLVEALRTDSLMIGPLKISQVVAAICVLAAIGIIIYNRMKGNTPKSHESGEEVVTED